MTGRRVTIIPKYPVVHFDYPDDDYAEKPDSQLIEDALAEFADDCRRTTVVDYTDYWVVVEGGQTRWPAK